MIKHFKRFLVIGWALAGLGGGDGILPAVESRDIPGLTALTSGCAAGLRGLSAAAGGVVWAGGSGGTVLRSVDEGTSWRDVSVPGAEKLDFRDVQAFDSNRAVVISAGRPAVVYRTTDGGRIWEETFRSNQAGVFFDSMAFRDDGSGVAFSDPVNGAFLVMTTEDGGGSWARIPADRLPAPRDGEAGFAASGTCVAVQGSDRIWIGTGGSVARVIRSTDRGDNWEAVEAPILSGTPSQGIFSLTFWDADHGVVVGGDYRDPDRRDAVIALTEDGGKTWSTPDVGPGGFRSAVAFRPARPGPELVAVGTGGVDFSRDGGKSWQSVSREGYHAVAFAPDGSTAWVAGAEGRIARLEFSR